MFFLNFPGEKYILEANSLKEYGVYRVTYIGEMIDAVSKQPINETLARKTGYFKIVPCPLKIIVDGGYEKTYKRGGGKFVCKYFNIFEIFYFQLKS